ncbi:BPSS1780 family membrane protein [Laribacter hongkongensis]|uniref:BPSS1780 family membrane protein n=1 Tax=Laribacter hongkongensis TaxID=168471 RepID=UPI001EFCF2AE|nr:BPSS1780 family membrane protein [Laribacter hongkongensis]MCG9058596.1 hypothetical protein [Laribacter hongkongensis]MCG9064814.1 hypothetical protein [Laribacter hongkongensis]MCG9086162.1 hypothetical protein [Laribacter hongkongensis]MCG9095212.1 hypothetical protein [Laribacter hongkongensis]MCG9116076.1 hypothetical protein [Laribacter hongkongensis]
MQATPLPAYQRLPAGMGSRWIGDAWRLFRDYPASWVVMGVLFFVIQLVLGLIPMLGQFLAAISTPVLMAGFAVAAGRVPSGQLPRINDLFACLSADRVPPFLLLGTVYLVLSMAVYTLAFLLAAGAGFGLPGGVGAGSPMTAAMGEQLLLALLMGGIPATWLLTMAFWLAPLLVLHHRLTPLVALRLSFMASAGSFAAFAIMFVGMTVLLFLAALPFGLGLLVWVPMSLLLPVVGYRSLFAAHA